MTNRRDFLKASLMVAAGMAASGVSPVLAAVEGCPPGLIYTSSNPGRWIGKEKTHAPVVSREGSQLTITTPHPMSDQHYIVRHVLLAEDGEILGDKTFFPTDKRAVSVYEVGPGKVPAYATSFCNQHDFWLTKI